MPNEPTLLRIMRTIGSLPRSFLTGILLDVKPRRNRSAAAIVPGNFEPQVRNGPDGCTHPLDDLLDMLGDEICFG